MKLNINLILKILTDPKKWICWSFQAKNLEFDRLKTHYVELRASLEGAQRVMFELGREQQSLQVERARMFDRNWLPDHHVTHCLSCNKEFSATLRKVETYQHIFDIQKYIVIFSNCYFKIGKGGKSAVDCIPNDIVP